jgi:hypothetical protein
MDCDFVLGNFNEARGLLNNILWSHLWITPRHLICNLYFLNVTFNEKIDWNFIHFGNFLKERPVWVDFGVLGQLYGTFLFKNSIFWNKMATSVAYFIIIYLTSKWRESFSGFPWNSRGNQLRKNSMNKPDKIHRNGTDKRKKTKAKITKYKKLNLLKQYFH